MKYIKPPISYQEQVDRWVARGLIIPDLDKALFCFQNISYYRLSAYALPFQKFKDTFNANTYFDDVLNLYNFDRELRILVIDAIERIEVALRTQLIYTLSHKYGSHWQDTPTIFKVERFKNSAGKLITKDVFTDTQNIIQEHCNTKYPEVFIKHYLDTYTQPANPPSWMIVELFTIGQLSRLFSGLKNNDDRRAIADYFKIHHSVFESWLHAITYCRNLCAHHSRFWNRDFVIQPFIPQKKLELPWLNPYSINNRRAFYFLCLIKYFLQTINPDNDFKTKLLHLINKYPKVPIQYMGIPQDKKGLKNNWQNEPLWQK